MGREQSPVYGLTSAPRLARNVGWNLLGQCIPLLAGLIAIPLLVDGLGTVRFGILAIAWIVIGYFNLFDFGLGRALTKLVAEKLGAEQDEDIPALAWTALALMAVLGLTGAGVLATLSPWLVKSVLKIPAEFQTETVGAFYLLAFSIPWMVSTAGLSGVLQAHQRFAMVNAARIPLGLWSFLGPLTALPFSKSILPVVALLVAGRVIGWGVHLVLCLRVVPALRHNMTVQRTMVYPLLSFGSWMTVSNIVGPFMIYFDRFLIGAMLSMGAVAYYATPYEVVTKLWVISGALVGVLFPAFSTTFVQDRVRAARLFDRGVTYTFLTLFPLTLVIVTLAHDGLTLWLNAEFALNSTRVLQLLAVGVLINALTHLPSALIQGAGRPDLRAKTHLIELPFYIFGLWWMVGAYGINGAAIAWVIRIAIDAIVFFLIARWLLPQTSNIIIKLVAAGSAAIVVCTLGASIDGFGAKCLFLLLVLTMYVLAAWLLILDIGDRQRLKKFFRALFLFGPRKETSL